MSVCVPIATAAGLLEVDDTSLGVPKRRLLIRMIDGATSDDRTVRTTRRVPMSVCTAQSDCQAAPRVQSSGLSLAATQCLRACALSRAHLCLISHRDGARDASCIVCAWCVAGQRVKNGLHTVLTDSLITITDTQDIMSTTNDAAVGLNALFTFVAALCSILIFFASWLSFDANIR